MLHTLCFSLQNAVYFIMLLFWFLYYLHFTYRVCYNLNVKLLCQTVNNVIYSFYWHLPDAALCDVKRVVLVLILVFRTPLNKLVHVFAWLHSNVSQDNGIKCSFLSFPTINDYPASI